ncbi:MAG: hypothetical protein GY874_04095 [Desulfobacteraceae bacterium]|nr:hypothetical protein [Desulfobacteraceae bacterium]
MKYFVAFVLIHILVCTNLRADTIVLKTGERFTSDKIWEENGKIRFNMNGLIIKIDKSEVDAIIVKDAQPLQRPSSNNRSAPIDRQIMRKSEKKTVLAPESGQSPETVTHEKKSSEDKSESFLKFFAPRKEAEPENISAPVKSIAGTGLKDLTWQMPPEQIPGLVFIKKDSDYQGIDQYHRPDDPLSLGRARLDGIVYGFWRNKLFSIMFWTEGPYAYRLLKKSVFDHYGQGVQANSGEERYIWRSQDTDRMLQFDSKLNTGFFWMRSRILDDQINQR